MIYYFLDNIIYRVIYLIFINIYALNSMYNGYTNIYGIDEAILTNSTHICMCV